MGFKNEYNFKDLENETERFVIQFLEEAVIADPGLCRCDDCILDMAAYALNHSSPSYRSSLLGKLYAQALDADDSYIKKVKKAVADAVRKIKANPSHA